MRQLMLAIAVGATALMSGYGAAVAQVAIEVPGAGVYVGPTYTPAPGTSTATWATAAP